MHTKTKRMDSNNNQTLWQLVKRCFNVMPGKASEDDVIAQITEGVDFHGANLWILILAIFIASLDSMSIQRQSLSVLCSSRH